jgi:hypothetical protein
MDHARPPFSNIEPLLLAAPALRDVGPWPFNWVGDTLRVMFACRVAWCSVLLALLVFIGVPQSRDLFLDFAGHAVITTLPAAASLPGATPPEPDFPSFVHGLFPWLVFFLVHILTWTIVVQSSARRALRNPAWLVGPKRDLTPRDLRIYRARFQGIVQAMPYVLAFGTFIAVAIGYAMAIGELPRATPVLADSRALNASAEILRQLDLRETPPQPPRLILNQSADFLRESAPGFWIAFALAAVTYPFWLAALERGMVGNGSGNGSLDPLDKDLPAGRGRYGRVLGMAADGLARAWLYGVFIVLLFVIVFADTVLTYLSGMFLVPLLFGAWVPVLTALGDWSMRTRVPLIFGTVVILALLAAFVGEMHDVGRATTVPRDRGPIAAAIERWKLANDCTDRRCPSPIIVTTAGGASRAAFFTGTVVGELLDKPCPDENQSCVGVIGDRPLFARRLFAISGVSGGSLGAVQIAAAIADHRAGRAPCGTPAAHWFVGGTPSTWRHCLQILASADFLSATTVALAFRDPFHFVNRLTGSNPAAPLMPDRAAVLERQWIRSYAEWTKPVAVPAGTSVQASSPSELTGGLARSFTELGPFSVPRGDWQPALILNGTSEDTGRRILTNHLMPTVSSVRRPDQKDRWLHVDAYDAHELITQASGRFPVGSTVCDRSKSLQGCDFTLASGASNSARFPIISPSGQLKSNDRLVDRIVDGGYFENDGAATTMELVRALKEAQLQPKVIHIANDPLIYQAARLANTQLPVPPATPDSRRYFSAINGPLQAMFAARVAHGSYAVEQLRRELQAGMVEFLVYGEPARGDTRFRKRDDITPFREGGDGCFEPSVTEGETRLKNVSMSWWLSKPVQEYLDRQTYFAPNCQAFRTVRDWLSEK